MNQNGMRKIGLMVLSLALAVIFVGCSTDSATGPNAIEDGSFTSIFTQEDPSRVNSEFEFVFSGRIVHVDAENRLIVFDGKEELTFYVDLDARVFLLPDRTEVPFIIDDGKDSRNSRAESSLEVGNQATAYGTLKGDDFVVVEVLEVWPNSVVVETAANTTER